MKNNFVENKLQTKQGDYIMRVYADSQGKETVVVYTEKINKKKPVLVRVHSECFTGDILHSLRCDCGEQLQKALELIQEKNGVLIYLRQEGRGIGLFEKIKAYSLQDKGYDTFEANVILGHNPDDRRYEKVKTALNDLGINKIDLLTNNPSKVSEIAKLGIKVNERVPLVIPSNKYNQKYFDAKKDKFKHFFSEEISYYFYQFHVDSVKQVEEIGEFLKNKKKDPLLKICIGVSADNSTLSNEKEISKIENIFKFCESYEGFVPILHFTFKKSKDTKKDIIAIKKKMPFVKYLQTNDLPKKSLGAIKLACELFLADIPLSDENFELIKNKSFRDTIKKYKAFLLLDNSKGTGKREPKESLMKKIDVLLKYGLNDIAIFGGFGSDDLDTYFELRRFYKINFSIDAESRLKTNGKIDLTKTKRYLQQLIRFDDPNSAGVEQTRTFLQQSKPADWEKTKILGKEFLIHPAVFNPKNFPSTEWYANKVSKIVKNQRDFCEVGCGTGVASCISALTNKRLNVISTDINPFATENTKLNVKNLELISQVKVYSGDVFEGIPKKSKFDSIFWALPFGFLDPGVKINLDETQVFDPGYRATRKFLLEAKNYLKKKGKLLIGFSEDLGNAELFYELAKEAGIKFKKIASVNLEEKDEINFELLEGKYLN
jgi:GTP cyclohydrolase II